ncbi:NADP-dependent oxidoreductase [Alphaproteobacteria bacterium]|nr:NADP-dependent oxidoreductase [Alphaproteobacteria bacterium]
MNKAKLPEKFLKVVLNKRPIAMPKENDFKVISSKLPELKKGQILVRSHYLSADPFQRMRLNKSSNYGKTLDLGDVIKGRVVGDVVKSNNLEYSIGDYVEGMLGWQEYCVSDGSKARAEYAPGITKINPKIAPISTALGILGFPGVTAYYSILETGKLQENETVVVSAAAGAVGSIAGQIAKIKNCKVIGITGTSEKADFLTKKLNFDLALNYNFETNLTKKIIEFVPNGVDVFIDCTGGKIADAVLPTLGFNSRVVLVGNISQNNQKKVSLRNDFQNIIMKNRSKFEGFIVYDFEDRADFAREKLSEWLNEEKLKNFETIEKGIENSPKALISMLNGGNIGKQIIKINI